MIVAVFCFSKIISIMSAIAQFFRGGGGALRIQEWEAIHSS